MNHKRLSILSLLILILSQGTSQSLPAYSVTVSGPQSTGYYFLTPNKIGPFNPALPPLQMILDHAGNLVYYKKFSGAGSTDFKIHWNGMISYTSNNKFYLMDSTFTIKDSLRAKNGIVTDLHDLQILPNGHYLILGSENVTMDLSSYNYFNGNSSPGSTTAIVKCGVIQEQDAAKNVVFQWHCKDHYIFADVDPFFLGNPNNVDWTHLNAVEYDTDGNYMLSVRHFNEITKINRSNGSIMWRLGGNANQFSFVNDAQQFKGQHDIRRIANGNITINDNGRANPLHPATAKEYQLNETALTAYLVWGYTENNSSFSTAIGNHQRLANGNSLINYGILNNLNHIFNVVNPSGTKVFEVVFADTLRSYRVFNYDNLPWDLKRPVITCVGSGQGTVLDAGSGYAGYLWNTGATTQTILVTNTGTCSVFVPKGQDGFISSPSFVVSNLNSACSTGLPEKNASPGQFMFFPNPVKDILTITAAHQPARLKIVINSCLGVNCYSAEFDGRRPIDVDVSGLAPGVYFLKINGSTKRFIRN